MLSKFQTAGKIKRLLWVCYQLILSSTVWEVWENCKMPPTTTPPYFSLFFPILLGGYHDKRKESLNRVCLTTGSTGITHTLTQPCVMWTLIRINPMSLSFNLHLMPCKMSQYSFCLMPQLEVLLVGCWELGEIVKCAMWVVVKHFEKFPRLFAGQLIRVIVLAHMSPEWCIHSSKGYFFWVGGTLCLLGIGVYIKEKKKNICIKILKMPHQKNINKLTRLFPRKSSKILP